MRTQNKTGYVLFSEGEYSDYQNTAFRVLKPFTLAETAAAFIGQWAAPKYLWRDAPYAREYVAWMIANGYIADAAEMLEIHLGDYAFLDCSPSDEIADTLFCPRDPPASRLG